MAAPGTDQFSIYLLGLLKFFVDFRIAISHEELGRAFGSCHHVYDRFIPPVSQLDSRPASLVQDCLPDVFVAVGAPVEDASVEKDDAVPVRGLRDFDENLFKLHLELHQVLLEVHRLREAHLLGLSERTSFLHDSSSLGYLKNSETHLLKHKSQLSQGSRLACAGTACETDARDRVGSLLLLGAGTELTFDLLVSLVFFDQVGRVDDLVIRLNLLGQVLSRALSLERNLFFEARSSLFDHYLMV